MDEKILRQILEKYHKGNASAEEKALLDAYYNLFEGRPNGLGELDTDEVNTLKAHIKKNIDTNAGSVINLYSKKTATVKRWSAAAAILITVGAGIIFYQNNKQKALTDQFAQYDIRPGKNKVVLTLANGAKIIIDPNKRGQVIKQGNTIISVADNGRLVYNTVDNTTGRSQQYNTITVPSGTPFQMTLADGSKVCINAGSTFRYPVSFSGVNRLVELQGEGYFEVAHNKLKPFIVKTAEEQVEVLGTHFNIKSYDDDRTNTTTLLEGSVKVITHDKILLLSPGQESRMRKVDHTLELVNTVDTEKTVAWKNGFFEYHNADIQAIMQDFSRWYGVKVIFEGNVHERLFSGAIHKDLTLLQALELLNYAKVHFSINDKQITISNN